jgi:putative phage-type endonuclease
MIAADPIVMDPGSPEWVRCMTASKVAAVLGLSPWQSRFSLWYEMAGAVEHQAGTPQQDRGHYLEDGVARWVADQHGLMLRPGGCWRNRERPWQVASPDRLVVDAVVEVKTSADWEAWGPDGTDEIPAYYRTQAVWQCDTLGVDTCYVGVLLPRLELRSYVIHPAPGEAEYIRDECRAFLDSIEAGQPPDVDKHSETYRVLRALHPDIDGTDAELPAAVATAYARAVLGLRVAEDEHVRCRNEIAQHMGSAQRARYNDWTVAIRQPGPTRVPFVKAGTTRALRATAEEESNDG